MPPRTRLRTVTLQRTKSAPASSVQKLPAKDASPTKRPAPSQGTSPEKSPRKKKPKTIVKQALLNPVPPPARWKETYGLIEEQRKTFIAPVDTMGCDKAGDVGPDYQLKSTSDSTISQDKIDQLNQRSERDRRLSCLVSLMLSSQTKDEVTAQATLNLRLYLKDSLTVDSLRNASLAEIENCINKVGFWKKKAQYIKLMADDLFFKHDSDVPKTLDELVALKGVGPKMAFLALSNAWAINLGIGVDTHVHRISNRLGWLQTSDPEATRINLESWLPRDLFQEINHLLVGFGQVICLPVGPKCEDCYVGKVPGLCPSSKVEANRQKLKPQLTKRAKSTASSTPSPKKPSRAHIAIKLEETDAVDHPDQKTSKQSPRLRSSRFFQNGHHSVKQEGQDPVIKDEDQDQGEKPEVDNKPTRPKSENGNLSQEINNNSEKLIHSPLVSSPLSEIDDDSNPLLCSPSPALAW
ncbi:DNA N-glycosylase and apurinic/apyrimidinic (AP) lyase [Puccinia graminis f. sp. tritici]|uniref:Endonuclease III homolog n=1 Tax=Puccinia graminis f. sp. tritici TaxID=56615 RepID=A0A5B0Q0P3_PUCGR|nr:DNA N-glycosylase and apurinic/apyrimidinic (AP) lyase [Puccinia graminis f. sp. tritici]